MDTQQQEQIGDKLRRAREAHGLSMRRAAKEAKVSEARWRQVEAGVQYRNGQAQPARATPETLVRMARAVDVDPVELLALAGYPPEVAENVQARLDAMPDTSQAPGVTPSVGGRIIDLSRFSDREAELIRTFALGIEARRNIE